MTEPNYQPPPPPPPPPPPRKSVGSHFGLCRRVETDPTSSCGGVRYEDVFVLSYSGGKIMVTANGGKWRHTIYSRHELSYIGMIFDVESNAIALDLWNSEGGPNLDSDAECWYLPPATPIITCCLFVSASIGIRAELMDWDPLSPRGQKHQPRINKQTQ